jgi:hypothetical protein
MTRETLRNSAVSMNSSENLIFASFPKIDSIDEHIFIFDMDCAIIFAIL